MTSVLYFSWGYCPPVRENHVLQNTHYMFGYLPMQVFIACLSQGPSHRSHPSHTTCNYK